MRELEDVEMPSVELDFEHCFSLCVGDREIGLTLQEAQALRRSIETALVEHDRRMRQKYER